MILPVHHFRMPGERLFHANSKNTNGIIIIPVAINTGCKILKSIGWPIAIMYGNGYNPDTKNHIAINRRINLEFLFKNPEGAFLMRLHLIHVSLL